MNAAGPYVAKIAAMVGETLPVENVFHQKIAFADALGAIDRRMWLARQMPGGIHCRPEGGDHGKWVKLGWAYNRTASEPQDELPTDPNFPDIVLRGASRLNPGLKRRFRSCVQAAKRYWIDDVTIEAGGE